MLNVRNREIQNHLNFYNAWKIGEDNCFELEGIEYAFLQSKIHRKEVMGRIQWQIVRSLASYWW